MSTNNCTQELFIDWCDVAAVIQLRVLKSHLLVIHFIKPNKVAIELVMRCSLSRDGRGADCALEAVVCYPVTDIEFINHIRRLPVFYNKSRDIIRNQIQDAVEEDLDNRDYVPKYHNLLKSMRVQDAHIQHYEHILYKHPLVLPLYRLLGGNT